MPFAIIADKIFTGDNWLTGHAVIAEGGKILDILPQTAIDESMEVRKHPDCIMVPAFIDLQIYGAYNRLLSVYPEADSLRRLNDYCRSGGAAWHLPTVATNMTVVFLRCIDAVRDYWSQGGEGVLGLHIEGPWINTAKKGAHPQQFIHYPSMEEVKELLDYGKGVIKMITLAPEVCSRKVIDYILAQGIIISAGHSNATYEQATAAFNGGIPVATHLYNAMSSFQHRAPGLVGAILDHDKAMASIIPDGHHVDYAAIRIAKKVLQERLFVITDAVTETGTGIYQHHLVNDRYESNGILSGSALTLNKAVRNLIRHCNIDAGEAIRMCSLYPARVIHMQHTLGKIEKGFSASVVLLDQEYNVSTLY